jgi:hypothetical protein
MPMKDHVTDMWQSDAHLITINNITITKGNKRSVNIQAINKESVTKSQFILGWEQWEDI